MRPKWPWKFTSGRDCPRSPSSGLPDTEVREAKDRVRAALNHTQFEFPARRITVNLAPADLPKDSGRFDLPIALGILAASGQIAPEALAAHEFAGELSLTGELRPVRGALAMALQARASARAFVLPEANAPQAALAEGAHVLPARTLLEVVAHLCGEAKLPRFEAPRARAGASSIRISREVKGQPQAKRALEVAAAGGHSVLMIGPPGTGKSMLAARFPGILPPMSEAEALEVAAIHSVSAAGFEAARWGERPYRAPHHSASGAAMVGGGAPAAARRDFARAPRRAVPGRTAGIRSRRAGIAARAARIGPRVDFARRAPVAVPGALPAGRGDEPLPLRPLRLARRALPLHARAHRALSRPRLRAARRPRRHQARSPGAARRRPDDARRHRIERGDPATGYSARTSASSSARACRTRCSARARSTGCARTDKEGDQLLRHALARLLLSARAYHRVLRVARTIADLAGEAAIGAAHIAEAIQYRRLDASF